MNELSTPPSEPVDWRCDEPSLGSYVIVTAQSAFVARREAALKLGADPLTILVVQVKK